MSCHWLPFEDEDDESPFPKSKKKGKKSFLIKIDLYIFFKKKEKLTSFINLRSIFLSGCPYSDGAVI